MDPRKSVLLFSGGLDSLCAAWLCRPDVLLYVHMGIRYQDQEMAAIAKMEKWLPGDGVTTTPASLLRLRTWERQSDRIVPNRNAMLVLIASMYGDVIQLASVRGDRSCDKDEEFCRCMTRLLNHTWQPQHWVPDGRVFDVTLPVKLYTKRQLLQRALHAGMPRQLVWDSWSCYEPYSQPCGWCKPCVRKYVAMRTAGVGNETEYACYFANDPRQAPWVPAAVQQLQHGTVWRGEEDTDFLEVMAGHGTVTGRHPL